MDQTPLAVPSLTGEPLASQSRSTPTPSAEPGTEPNSAGQLASDGPAVAAPSTGLRRALLLMTSTSLLVPLAGIVTAPILAQSLGVDGRGEVAAALAPYALIVAVATLGLPEALTFHLARAPGRTRAALGRAAGIGLSLAVLCCLAAWLALPWLSGGDRRLGELIGLTSGLAVPALGVGLLRGAAIGRQWWSMVAREKAVSSVLRVALLAGLALTGQLTVLSAVLVSALGPLVAGLAYWPLLRRPPVDDDHPGPGGGTPAVGAGDLLRYGGRFWLGAVASMLLGRLGPLLFIPLADVGQLGLFVIAVTVSDVPLIVATAVRDAVFGVSAQRRDAERVAATSRLTLLAALATCLVLGASLPWWIERVFGAGFGAAVLATWLLLAASAVSVPGLLAGAGLSAWGRPGLRSIGLGLSLVVNVTVFVAAVPPWGAVGGALAALAGSIVATGFATGRAARLLGLPWRAFVVPARGDLDRLLRWIPARQSSAPTPRSRTGPDPERLTGRPD